MKKYQVKCIRTITSEVILNVEANSEDEAKEIAEEDVSILEPTLRFVDKDLKDSYRIVH